MKLLTLSLFTALSAGAWLAPTRPHDAVPFSPDLPAESWAPRDTADSLWRRGRIAISDESWADAADQFRRIAAEFPKSTYAGDALYWEAFALQRMGRQSDLRRAVAALDRQKTEYPKAQTFASGESNALATRLKGRLARSGDSDAAADVADMAEAIASAAVLGVGHAMAIASEELARVRPELERSMAEARRSMDQARAEMRSGRRGDDIPEGCEDAVDDERVEALNAMLQMNSQQALPILKKVLARRDKCSELLRRKAVFLVSQQNSDEAVDILLEAAKGDPDRKTREDAVFWLSQTDSERATEVLEQILLKEAPDREMQKKAVFSISQSDTERSQRVLRDFIQRKDVDPEVRNEAIFWLGQSGDGRNSAFLREVFPSLTDREAKEKVLFSLSQHESSANTRFLLDRAKDRTLDADLRKTALFWAGQGGASVKDLSEIYDSAADDREFRDQIVFTLSQSRESGAIDKLIDIAKRETDRDLRKKAIFWLGQSRDPKAVKYLEELVSK